MPRKNSCAILTYMEGLIAIILIAALAVPLALWLPLWAMPLVGVALFYVVTAVVGIASGLIRQRP